MNSLVVPGTNITITDGSIVMLSRFPGKKWIAHYGWYTYNDQQMMGWYFCSIPENSVLPVNDMDLGSITVVSGGGACPCPPPAPNPTPYPPCPNPGDHNQFSDQDKWELDRAFITVNTIAERDALNDRLLPDGKLVRVNNDGDSAAYFRWNQVLRVWEEEFFGGSVEGNFLTEEKANRLFAKQSEVDEIRSIADRSSASADSALSKAADALTKSEDATSTAVAATELAQHANEQYAQLSESVTDLKSDVSKVEAKAEDAIIYSQEAKAESTEARESAQAATVAVNDAKTAAQLAQVAAAEAQTQVQEIQQNLEQIVTETVEQVISDEKVAEAVNAALIEKLPSAVEAEVAEQLGDADWGSLA